MRTFLFLGRRRLIVVVQRLAQKSSDDVATNLLVDVAVVAAVDALVDVVANVQRRVVREAVGTDGAAAGAAEVVTDAGAVAALLEHVAPRSVQSGGDLFVIQDWHDGRVYAS